MAVDEAAPRAKKVAVIIGSPHRGGATEAAARKLVDRLEAFGDVTGELVALSDYDIGVCRGCKVCFDRGEEYCPLHDDRDLVIGKMMDADAVVLASPNYSWQVSGLMKVFLDRLGFAFHRPQFHGRSASTIVVQGIAFGGRIRKYLEFVEGGLGFKVVKGSVITTLEPMSEKALRRMDRALTEQAARIHRQLLKPAFPTPSFFELMMFRMGRTGIRLNAPQDLRDWAYYRDKGWFDSAYYYPTRLGWPKRVAGAFFDWVVGAAGLFSVAGSESGQDEPPVQAAR